MKKIKRELNPAQVHVLRHEIESRRSQIKTRLKWIEENI